MSLSAAEVILYIYWFFCLALVLFGLPQTFHLIKFPTFIVELFEYGKTRGSGSGTVSSPLVKLIEIPKQWFLHFYIFGLVVSSYMLAATTGAYFFGIRIPGVNHLAATIEAHFFGIRIRGVNHLAATAPEKQPPVIDEYAVVLMCAMMFIQHFRRLYECIFVSVYSKGTMNIIHYFMGALLYATVQYCALVDGPSLMNKKLNTQLPATADELLMVVRDHWMKFVGTALFLYASLEHHRAHVILGNLRKDKTGQKVLHRQHVTPRGGMFEYLSAPHFVFEMLIYLAMGIVAWKSYTFWLGPVLFTIVNQALMVNETHQWYQATFPNYPKNRKRFIPYLF